MLIARHKYDIINQIIEEYTLSSYRMYGNIRQSNGVKMSTLIKGTDTLLKLSKDRHGLEIVVEKSAAKLRITLTLIL